MKRNGFSLIEAMFAGVVMIGMAMGAYQLISSTWKSTGDLEKRNRYRDLVDDIRFVFSEPNLCRENFSRFTLTEGADITLNLAPGSELKGQMQLADYGLQIDRLYLKNVRSFPSASRSLFRPSGEILGSFEEKSEVADVYVEASLLGGKQKLKAMAVVRVTSIQRTGGINETYCFGNHMSVSSAAGAGHDRLPSSSSTSDGSPPPPQPDLSRPVGGSYQAQDCVLENSGQRERVGKARLVNGEIVVFQDFDARTTTASCNQGQFVILKKE